MQLTKEGIIYDHDDTLEFIGVDFLSYNQLTEVFTIGKNKNVVKATLDELTIKYHDYIGNEETYLQDVTHRDWYTFLHEFAKEEFAKLDIVIISYEL